MEIQATYDKENLVLFFVNSNLVSRATAEEIAAIFQRKEIAKNEFLLTEGQLSDEYVFLDEGFMRTYTFDLNGAEVTTAFHQKRKVVFEVSSFFNRTPSKENIQALTHCNGWFITYAQLQYLFHAIPEFREFGRSVLVKGFVSLKQRMLSHINETAETRYANLLLTNPEVFKHASLKHISSYLGITDTSLSRIRKEFSKK